MLVWIALQIRGMNRAVRMLPCANVDADSQARMGAHALHVLQDHINPAMVHHFAMNVLRVPTALRLVQLTFRHAYHVWTIQIHPRGHLLWRRVSARLATMEMALQIAVRVQLAFTIQFWELQSAPHALRTQIRQLPVRAKINAPAIRDTPALQYRAVVVVAADFSVKPAGQVPSNR